MYLTTPIHQIVEPGHCIFTSIGCILEWRISFGLFRDCKQKMLFIKSSLRQLQILFQNDKRFLKYDLNHSPQLAPSEEPAEFDWLSVLASRFWITAGKLDTVLGAVCRHFVLKTIKFWNLPFPSALTDNCPKRPHNLAMLTTALLFPVNTILKMSTSTINRIPEFKNRHFNCKD